MRKIVLALGVIVTLVMAGCASDKGINETGYSKKPLTDRHGHKLEAADAKRLYQSARDYLMHGQPAEALPLYAQVTARFPFSKYAQQSALETIAARYQSGKYDEAVDAADRFIKQHPRNPHIDYVYYMRGRSNYAHNNRGFFLTSNPDSRNVAYLKQAFNDFKILLNNYPNSDYAKDARLHMLNIRNRLAHHDLHVAEYYYRRRAYVAASRRAKEVVKRYQGSDSIPRALEVMEQSYAKLNLSDLAEDTRALLQASYPNYLLHRNEFYRQQAGDKPKYKLPDLGAPPAEGETTEDESSDHKHDSEHESQEHSSEDQSSDESSSSDDNGADSSIRTGPSR